MANTAVTSQTEWVDGASDYTQHFCNPHMQEALNVYAMALELAAVGGTDYSSDLESLIAASDAVSNYMNPDQLRAAEVNINFQNATNAGASVPSAIGDKLEACKTLLHYDLPRVLRAKQFLKGSLGYHSSF